MLLKKRDYKKMIKYKNIFLVSLFTLTAIGLITIISGSPVEIHAGTDETAALASNWENIQQPVSIGDPGAPYAIKPTIAEAPNGRTVLVVYSTQMDGDSKQNLYYSFSNKNGESGSWPNNQQNQQLNESDEISSKPYVTFDQSGRAHAVWTEGLSIAYAKSVSVDLSEGFLEPTVFPNIPGGNPDASDPKVITYGNNDVHIIWAESNDNTPDPNIYHRHSTSGGELANESDENKGWGTTYTTPKPITTQSLNHENPTVTVDDSGNLHVLYQKRDRVEDESVEQIRYTKLNNGDALWPDELTHTDVTTDIPGGPPYYDVLKPHIIYVNGHLEVSVTQRYLEGAPSEKHQYVFHIGCSISCENPSNWIATRVTNTVLFIDAKPDSLTSSIMRIGNCLNIVFDGKSSTDQSKPEQVFLSSSCSGWGDNLQELTPRIGSRTIQPIATSTSNWWGYTVYEEFVGTDVDANKQVFFVRNSPAVYLPVIMK